MWTWIGRLKLLDPFTLLLQCIARFWHECDIVRSQMDVRFRGKSNRSAKGSPEMPLPSGLSALPLPYKTAREPVGVRDAA
jgi:hypothetical protein